jgi:hypothetical protein
MIPRARRRDFIGNPCIDFSSCPGLPTRADRRIVNHQEHSTAIMDWYKAKSCTIFSTKEMSFIAKKSP